jgi:signal transduction histidine kinase
MIKITQKELMKELKLKAMKNNELVNAQTELMAQLKQVNDKLMNSERIKSNFLSNIRNEINNPISAVLELSKSLLNRNIQEVDKEKFSQLIYNEVFYLDFQLRNIINSAELEAGETKLSPSHVNVNSILSSVLDSFQHLIEKKELHIHQTLSNVSRQFVSDPEKLHLILSNLLANAVRFCNEDGNILIDIMVDSNTLHIKIKNSGSSIPKENESVIFDRFRQMEEGSIKTYIGHGLGLSITKALLELMDGDIKLNNDTIGATEFVVSLKELDMRSNSMSLSEDGNDFIFDNIHDTVF